MKTKIKIKKNRFLSFKIHKYLGIPLAVIMLYMSISGILINHPTIIENINWPGTLLPSDMQIKNWGRSAVLSAVKYKDDSIVLGGRLGILIADKNKIVKSFNNGLSNAVNKKTVNILYYDKDNDYLYAGLKTGLYYYDQKDEVWKFISGLSDEVVSIVKVDERVVAFTKDDSFFVEGNSFKKNEKFRRDGVFEFSGSMSLVQYVYHMHSGELWGIFGKIIMDITALIMIVLSISGLIIWLYPKKKKNSSRFKKIKIKLHKYHMFNYKRIGILFVIPILLLPLTGFFMRPPTLMALVGKNVKTMFAHEDKEMSTWGGSISKVFIDDKRDKVIVYAGGSLYEGPKDFSTPFYMLISSLPVHPMGALALDIDDNGDYIIGSFSGLMRWNRETNIFKDFYTGQMIYSYSIKQKGPFQVNGLIKLDDKKIVIDYRKGLYDLSNYKEFLLMPKKYNDETTFSLWSFMFELHNGRIYKSIIPKGYILVNPLVSLFAFILPISGFWLLFRRGILFKKRKKK